MPTSLEISVSLMKSHGTDLDPRSLNYGREDVYEFHQDSFLPALIPSKSKVKPTSLTLIPVNKDQWLDFMVHMVRNKTCLRYLSDKELRRVIARARKNFAFRSEAIITHDPNLPECFGWNEEQVADWMAEQGHPELREAFITNRITGRKLVAVDANALIKIGIRQLDQIREISSKIRELLNIPQPNMMRALMRLVPFESYLKRRLPRGRTYDQLTFEKFCSQQGFPYNYLLSHSKNAEIPCTCRVDVRLPRLTDEVSSESDSDSEISLLRETPTVEFVARRILTHNKIVQELIDELLACIVEEPEQSCYGIQKTMSHIMLSGCKTLGLTSSDCSRRMQFASSVAHSLIVELQRTAHVLQDIQETRKQVRRNVSEAIISDMREAVTIFMEQVLPLATLMSLGEFSLENIFRQESEFQDFVQGVTADAEGKIQAVLPEAEAIVHDVVDAAEKHLNLDGEI